MIESLITNGYAIIPNFLSKHQIDSYLTLSLRMIRDESKSETRTNPLWEGVLISELDRISDLVDEDLVPTFSFQKTYLKGSEQPPSMGNGTCQISCTINLGQTHQSPFYIYDIELNSDVEIIQNPGDMLIYLGHNLQTYRKVFDGDYYSQLTLNYVFDNEANDPYKWDLDYARAQRIFDKQRVKNPEYLMKQFDDMSFLKVKDNNKEVEHFMTFRDAETMESKSRVINFNHFKSTRKPRVHIEDYNIEVPVKDLNKDNVIRTFRDSMCETPEALSPNFCSDIIDFFEDILDSYKNKTKDDSTPDINYGVTHKGIDPNIKKTLELDLMKLEDKTWSNHLSEVSNYCIENYVKKYGFQEMFNGLEVFNSGDDKAFYPMWEVHKYDKGDGHYNAWHTEGNYIHEFSNRIFVSMYYLNDVYEGGRTVFPYARGGITPTTGKHFSFPTGFPYVHYAEIPKSNDKYIITSWLCAKWDGFEYPGNVSKEVFDEQQTHENKIKKK